jgi:hypothetical protein
VAVLSVACIVVGNDFPRAAPDRQAEQDPGRVLNKAAAVVEKKLDAFAVYITPPLYSPQLQHSRHDDTPRAALRANRLRFRYSAITRNVCAANVIASARTHRARQ